MTDYLVSALAAVAAGLCLAAAGVMQQRAASGRPKDERMSLRLLGQLATERLWVGGILLAVVSYGFQALALATGPLVLMQPLVVSELLFAVPISVRLRNLRLRPRDRVAVVLVVAGVTIGIVAAAPARGQSLQPFDVWLPALGAVSVITVVAVVVARRLQGPGKASAFAFAGACVMGLQSALYAATIAQLQQNLLGLATAWETYALVAVSFLGLFLIQNAFHAGPLAASAPVADSVLPLVAITLGVWLFGEQVRMSALGLLGGMGGLVLMITGIVLLDTSPVVRHEEKIEDRQKEEQREPG